MEENRREAVKKGKRAPRDFWLSKSSSNGRVSDAFVLPHADGSPFFQTLHESRENEHGQRRIGACNDRATQHGTLQSKQTNFHEARALPRSSFSRKRGFHRFNNSRAACMEEEARRVSS